MYSIIQTHTRAHKIHTHIRQVQKKVFSSPWGICCNLYYSNRNWITHKNIHRMYCHSNCQVSHPVSICQYIFAGNCVMSVFKSWGKLHLHSKVCVFEYLYVSMCACCSLCVRVCVLFCLCVLLCLCLFVCKLVCWRLYALVRTRILDEWDFEATNIQTDVNPSAHITNTNSNLNVTSTLNLGHHSHSAGRNFLLIHHGEVEWARPITYVTVNKLLLNLQVLLCFFLLLVPISSVYTLLQCLFLQFELFVLVAIGEYPSCYCI